MIVKHSPLFEYAKQKQAQFDDWQGWQVAKSYGSVDEETAVLTAHVTLSDQSHNGKIRIEGKTAGAMLQADELAIGEGKAVDYGRIYRLRRDLFFVSVEEDVAEVNVSLARQASDIPDLITVTDVTHGNAELWLIGPKSAELLSRLCGLDFDDSAFPNGVAKQTSVAKITQLIIRRDLGDAPAFALIGGRSIAAYLWQTILEAGENLDIQPVGNTAIAKLGE
ncbi:MAG: aminomethyl transferase family protein [Chloroflexi bacterium]|nr:aminomethyl transferase family protein [Chloroflexota bacterium]